MHVSGLQAPTRCNAGSATFGCMVNAPQMVFAPFVVPHPLPVGVLQCGGRANPIKSGSCRGLGFNTTQFVC